MNIANCIFISEDDDEVKTLKLFHEDNTSEIITFNSQGKCDLSPIGYKKEHNGDLTKKILKSSEESAIIASNKLRLLGCEVNEINQSILVFSKSAEANSIEELNFQDNAICIISAPGNFEITHDDIPASELRVIVKRARKRAEGEHYL